MRDFLKRVFLAIQMGEMVVEKGENKEIEAQVNPTRQAGNLLFSFFFLEDVPF